jgi:hypothetical protein
VISINLIKYVQTSEFWFTTVAGVLCCCLVGPLKDCFIAEL